MTFDATWHDIDKQSTPSGVVRRRIEPDLPFDLFLEQERPSRLRSFIAVFAEAAGPFAQQIRSSRGLEVEVSWSVGSTVFKLTERDARYKSVFDALVIDLVSGLRRVVKIPAVERPAPPDFVAGRILRWQNFLKAGPDGLSEESQVGLFAELKVILRLVEEGVPVRDAVAAWTGPMGAPQDFQFDRFSVEVKASRQAKPTTIRVSSERQLDTKYLGRLYLVHLAIDAKANGAGDSLPRLVESVRELAGRTLDLGLSFDDALLAYGYVDSHASRYNARLFMVRDMDIFEVRNGFPRITEDLLPEGVGSVSYGLALSACEQYRMNPLDFWAAVAGDAA
ncbi:PD-(D/E)XK motif protein [Micromonospora sp. NPDC000089]|uniref:PD-(D/E)XK motif protein n=1 Tax=unclassified Micromonospora TaxID=2617518 RepID=UPI00369EA26D